LQRTLEELTEVIKALLSLHSPQTITQAEEALKKAYQQHTGSSADLFRQLPTDQLLAVLSSAGVVDREKAYLLASLFYVEAELQLAKGLEPSVAMQLKALDLYLEAATDDVDAEDLDERIAALLEHLADFVLPEATQWRRFNYAQYTGKYSDAEDKLFDLLGEYGASETVKHYGRSFYKRLLQSSDDDLEKGGLPRTEVEEGREAFEQELLGT
jgi:hypothetical protein